MEFRQIFVGKCGLKVGIVLTYERQCLVAHVVGQASFAASTAASRLEGLRPVPSQRSATATHLSWTYTNKIRWIQRFFTLKT